MWRISILLEYAIICFDPLANHLSVVRHLEVFPCPQESFSSLSSSYFKGGYKISFNVIPFFQHVPSRTIVVWHMPCLFLRCHHFSPCHLTFSPFFFFLWPSWCWTPSNPTKVLLCKSKWKHVEGVLIDYASTLSNTLQVYLDKWYFVLNALSYLTYQKTHTLTNKDHDYIECNEPLTLSTIFFPKVSI